MTLKPTQTATEARSSPRPRARRFHWHVFFTHFPISLFGTAFLFQLLHLFSSPESFELAGTVCLVTGAGAMIPATLSGWLTWRRHYHGTRSRLFRIKFWSAVGMLVISIPLAAWRVTLYFLGSEVQGTEHVLVFSLSALLIAGATIEGLYGGRLAHR